MSLTNFQNEFEKLLDRKYFSSEIHPLRKDAFSKLEATGFPTQKWEDWRFTNLSVLMDNHFLISEVEHAPQDGRGVRALLLREVEVALVREQLAVQLDEGVLFAPPPPPLDEAHAAHAAHPAQHRGAKQLGQLLDRRRVRAEIRDLQVAVVFEVKPLGADGARIP